MRIVPPRPGALGSDRPVTADGCVRVTVTDCPAGRSILLSDYLYPPPFPSYRTLMGKV